MPDADVVSGKDLQLAFCNGGDNQKWTLHPSGSFSVIKPFSNPNLCVDVENGSTGVARIQLHTCNNQTNQRFRFRTFLAEVTVGACSSTVTIAARLAINRPDAFLLAP